MPPRPQRDCRSRIKPLRSNCRSRMTRQLQNYRAATRKRLVGGAVVTRKNHKACGVRPGLRGITRHTAELQQPSRVSALSAEPSGIFQRYQVNYIPTLPAGFHLLYVSASASRIFRPISRRASRRRNIFVQSAHLFQVDERMYRYSSFLNIYAVIKLTIITISVKNYLLSAKCICFSSDPPATISRQSYRSATIVRLPFVQFKKTSG